MKMAVKTTTASTGFKFGNRICQKIRRFEAPSILAASSSSSGIVRKNWRQQSYSMGCWRAIACIAYSSRDITRSLKSDHAKGIQIRLNR